MSKVLCRDCVYYDHTIHSCARLDAKAGDFVSWVFDECWCSTEEGAREMTARESFLRYGPYWRAYREMEDDMTVEEINRRFDYHAPDDEKRECHEAVRYAVKELATTINDLCPEGREQALAMTYLELAMFEANAAIARS